MSADRLLIIANGDDVIQWLTNASEQTHSQAVQLVRHYGLLMQASVKAHAAGRPGPRMISGDYNRSISLDVDTTDAPAASVGTNRPQARRLEFGFMGMRDRLGRLYHQPPFPHFGPAFDEVAPRFEEAAASLIDTIT